MTENTPDRQRQASQSPAPPLWANPRLVAAALAVLLFLVFVFQNTRSVAVSFLFWSFRMPLIILMSLCALAGVGVWELGRYVKHRREASAAGR